MLHEDPTRQAESPPQIAYLKDVLDRLPTHPTDRLSELLPDTLGWRRILRRGAEPLRETRD
jgi:hypothetical protein